MADKQQKQQAVEVLCWGACAYQSGPCTVYWQYDRATQEFGRRASEGDVVTDFPEGSIPHEVEAGHVRVLEDGGK
jgi:hypothetical protein